MSEGEIGPLEQKVRDRITEAFAKDLVAGAPVESLLNPFEAYGLRDPKRTARHALQLAIGTAEGVLEIARELDSRSR
jgi:hypothetical protein